MMTVFNSQYAEELSGPDKWYPAGERKTTSSLVKSVILISGLFLEYETANVWDKHIQI